MNVKNLPALDAAVRAVCPLIDGVAADGFVFFQAGATPAQRSAAAAAVAAFVDSTPPGPVAQVPVMATLLPGGIAPPNTNPTVPVGSA